MRERNTIVTFPKGSCSEKSIILHAQVVPNEARQILLIVEKTPFHPVDHIWPDQPCDKGHVIIQDKTYPLVNCVMAAINKLTGELLLDKAIKERKIRRDDADWLYHVAHIIEDVTLTNSNLQAITGMPILLEVDKAYRQALSAAHTACHIASLALNAETQDLWEKTAADKDSLGHPNLDENAIAASSIYPDRSVDVYHCSTKLRKLGFNHTRLMSQLKQIESAVNHRLSGWTSMGDIRISVMPKEADIAARRQWHCFFSDGKEARIPCGGTHLDGLNTQNKINVELEQKGDADFVMITRIK